MIFVNSSELTHRICNGFLSHDGKVDGKFIDIYKENGLDVEDPIVEKTLKSVISIVESMEKEGLTFYPRNVEGNRIREIRLKQNLSVRALAEISGLSSTAIVNIEKGLNKPRPITLHRLADALYCSVDDFRKEAI